jgi:NAD(P)H-nitrite reductase large subunit
MTLQLVDGMEQQPNCCTICGCNPTEEGKAKKAIFASGVDVDWGNALYICMECAELIADLIDREPRRSFDTLQEKYDALVEEHLELQTVHEHDEELLNQIRKGTKAQREIRSGVRETELVES